MLDLMQVREGKVNYQDILKKIEEIDGRINDIKPIILIYFQEKKYHLN